MELRRLRLAREAVLDFPSLKDYTNQPLSFRPDMAIRTVTPDVLDDIMIQQYLSQGMLEEIDEEGKPLPPPPAPNLVPDSMAKLSPQREERPAGANPEDGTKPASPTPKQVSDQQLSVQRMERPAGANPEDGTASKTGGMVSAGKVIPEVPQSTEGMTTTPTQQGTGPELKEQSESPVPNEQNSAPANSEASPESAEELASRRDQNTLSEESAARKKKR